MSGLGSGIPPFDGRHLWVYTGTWRVHNPGRARQLFEPTNLLSVTSVGCYHCLTLWRPDIGAHCPGEKA